MEILIAHKFEVMSILWLCSEIMASVPSIKANSVFQLCKLALGKVLGK